jgi:threonyl-tRNA synthetase
MHGLFRARGFTQDDGHIFCLPDQISAEIVGVLNLMEQVLSTFGFSQYEVNLSTRPEKSVGGCEVPNLQAVGFIKQVKTANLQTSCCHGLMLGLARTV